METNKSHFFKGNSFFVTLLSGSILLLLIFICVATFSGAWPGSDISAQILSALAGAVVTAMITLFLLLGQTANEEKKERNAKIFEEKLRIYNEFLQKLCSVVSDMKIERNEEIELEFQVAQIAMHTSSESIKAISAQVRDIIVRIKKKEAQQEEMLSELFEIADTFYLELYKTPNEFNVEDREKTLENFRSILVTNEDLQSYEEAQRKAIIDAYGGEEKLTLTDRAKLLKAKIKDMGSRQWIYNRTVLVHDISIDDDSNNNIVVQIEPDSSTWEYYVTIFVRTWNLDEIKKIAKDIWPNKDYPSWPEEESCRLLYRAISYEEIDHDREGFVKDIENVLSKIKDYCDKHYSLK